MQKIIFLFLIILFQSQSLSSKAAAKIVTKPFVEFRARGGFPNFFTKIYHGDTIKMAYLGGSITAQDGWRVLSLEWFKKRFPGAAFSEINAAIGGTGSDFGAFRLKDHVLKFKPDLVFVEFAVNDDSTPAKKIIRSMEGIVRQIWQQNPLTDICFVYTLTEQDIPAELNGMLPISALTMEKIADKYQIPTINFGYEVTKMVRNKDLIMKGANMELNGIKIFSGDGVHPYAETGHLIYCEALKSSFETMASGNNAKTKKHLLSKPLAPDCFSNTQMVDFTQGTLSKNWQVLQIADQPAFHSFGKFLDKFGKAGQSGETLTVNFTGTAIGMYDIMGPDAGRLIVEIDGCVKHSISRFDRFCTYRRLNYFLIDNLANKTHKVIFQVVAEPFDKVAILKTNGEVMGNPADYIENNWYVGKILIDGTLISPNSGMQ
jgi:lysophospholipase L1-like esterase